MSRSPSALLSLFAAALLAAGRAAAGVAETAPVAPAGAPLAASYDAILTANDLRAAESFLADARGQRELENTDGLLYERVFLRASELADMKGLLMGAADARSIRLGVLKRPDCAFCLDAARFAAWARAHMPWLDASKYPAISEALWAWETLSKPQKDWVTAKKKAAEWPKLGFEARHRLMREWALAEREALLRANPGEMKEMDGFHARTEAISKVLGTHEMSAVWNRAEEASQAVASLAQARAKIGKNADKRQRELLAAAAGASTPEARLAALSAFFENRGERPRELLEAAPPRDDQRFDDRTRGVVSEMLKGALLKETEGTFAGADLQEFYAKTPLSVTFTTTSYAALGWYSHGGDTLYFNERYLEQYLKSRGLSVEDVMRNPESLGDLARTLVGTFVHEAQHHRQDVWSREQGLPRRYVQSDEVEAFQAQGLFLLEKLKTDKRFAEFAAREGERSAVLRAGLGRARRMEEAGPDWFEYVVPNSHYPEVYSNEGAAWCAIVVHNRVAEAVSRELARRETLGEERREALEKGPALRPDYASREDFTAALASAGTPSLRLVLDDARKTAEDAPKYYNQIRSRRAGFRAQTEERYAAVMEGRGGRRSAEPPAPGEEGK